MRWDADTVLRVALLGPLAIANDLRGSGGCVRSIPAAGTEVLQPGQVLVHGGVLAGEADADPDLMGVSDVVSYPRMRA